MNDLKENSILLTTITLSLNCKNSIVGRPRLLFLQQACTTNDIMGYYYKCLCNLQSYCFIIKLQQCSCESSVDRIKDILQVHNNMFAMWQLQQILTDHVYRQSCPFSTGTRFLSSFRMCPYNVTGPWQSSIATATLIVCL